MARAVKRKRTYNAALRQEQARATRTRIVEAGRRLLAKGTYSSVTIEEIAEEAGVSYQTVYSVFGTKLKLAHAIIEVGFHVEDVEEQAAEFARSRDPEVWLRGVAQISRSIQERCADLFRFMRESGDPQLLARYREHQTLRLTQEGFLPDMLARSGRLRRGLIRARGPGGDLGPQRERPVLDACPGSRLDGGPVRRVAWRRADRSASSRRMSCRLRFPAVGELAVVGRVKRRQAANLEVRVALSRPEGTKC